MSQPFVSIIVPTRNRAELLRDSLESLLVLDYPHDRYEIIVVDDGSEDETACLVGSLGKLSGRQRVRCCRQQSGGINRARNRGIAEAQGEVMGIVDDDEIAPAGLVREAVRLLMEDPRATAVGGWYRVRREGQSPAFVCRQCWESFKSIEYPGGIEQAAEVADLPGGCLFAWRDAFRLHGVFDDALSQPGDDTEWCARVRQQGGRLVMGRDVWVWHRALPADFGLRGLWKKCVRSMRYCATARWVMGWSGSWLSDLRQGMRFLAHGLRHGCLVGLFRGIGYTALAWEWGYVQLRYARRLDRGRVEHRLRRATRKPSG